MESNDLISSNLQVDYQAAAYLKEAAKWAKFLAILGFIFSGLVVLAALIVMLAGTAVGNLSGSGLFSSLGYGMVGFIYLVAAVIGFFVALVMYRFATRTLAAIASDDSLTFTTAMSSLRMYFRILGIFTIIYLALVVLGILFAFILGISNAM
jgi:uncharacterized membrane protein